MAARYEEYAPGAALEPFVECFWSVATREPDPAYLVLPDGCVDIVFWPEGGLRAVGAMTARQTNSLPARACIVGVRFQPGAAGAFLKLAPRELTDRWAPLESIWGERGRRLFSQLGEAASAGDRLAVLAGALRPPDNGRDAVRKAVAAMVAAGGALDLDCLARQANLSPRHFRRRCLDETGLAPKQLCRVLRFRRALGALRRRPQPGWAHIAAECGYYDQAHLIHDFREFSGFTPAGYALAVFSNPPPGRIA